MQTIGRYVVEGEVGRGSSGVVYRARDPLIGRVVAIKQIRFDEIPTPEERQRLRERLFREAQSAGALSHAGIVTIYDIQEEQGAANIFMEYVEGETLEQILKARQLTSEETRAILEQTASALDFAHVKGVVHRDIKPANLMITSEGSVKVADFGIARMQSQNATQQTGSLLGTPTYMAPEQIQGRPAGARADQFSLGVVAYEMLTGHTPYRADSIPSLLYQVVAQQPPPARQSNPSLSGGVEAALNRVLSKDPIARFESCAAFVAALSGDWKTVAHEPELTLPTMAFSPMASAPAPVKRRSSALGMLMAIAAVIGLTVGAFTYFEHRPPEEPPRETVSQPAIVSTPVPQSAEPPKKEEEPPPQPRPPVVVQPFDSGGVKAKDPIDAGEYAIRILTTPPGARVLLDSGSPTCTSPCSLALGTGRHTLAITSAGYQSAYRIMQVPEQTEVSVKLDASTGKLSLISTPEGAEIRVDGTVRPERTPAVLTLPVGKHRVTITLPGREAKEREIEIGDGSITEFRVTQ